MQHNEDHDAVESLLRAHSDAIEHVRVLCRSPGRHWIHQQFCELALASTYKQALQKLTNMLTALLLSHRLSAQHLQILLKPALDTVLAAILQGNRFLESCRSPLAFEYVAANPYSRRRGSSLSSAKLYSFPSSASSYTDGSDALREGEPIEDVDKSWLLRALLNGLATDAMDVHLHDFLVAFFAVGAAVQDLNAQISSSKTAADLTPSPDFFWRTEQNNPHVLLVSARQLDQAKQNDETVLDSQLEQITMNLRVPPPGDGDAAPQQQYTATTLTTVDDAAQLAAFVKDRMRCAKQAFQESLDAGFLDINQLEVVDTIADSFWTRVHRVRWLGEEFALKVYKKGMEAAFQQEAKIHVRLNHPNVVHAMAIFKGEQKEYGILMDLMDETLQSFLQRHAFCLSLQEKVRIMLHIAKGMAYVHARGVIHRDLKPSNVLVCSKLDSMETPYTLGMHQLEVKVADFGESRSRMPNSSSFKTKKVGTTVYRAPEVLNDDIQSSYNKSADVYSFAMTCFELLAETEPFHEAEKTKALWEGVVVLGERPDLESFSDDDCPPYLKHCLTTWWAQEPKTRHSFTHICCVLRHLYACLARCRSDMEPIRQFPFLAWPFWRWKKAQDIAQKRLDQLETRREEDDWKYKGYLCECTRVNEIPYEMHVMEWAIKKVGAEDERDGAIDGAAYSAKLIEPPRPPQVIMSRSDPESSTANTQATATAAAPQAQDTRSTSNKSFGEKLKEFCCFSAEVTPSNHEAFHDNIPRRNQ